MRGQQGVADVPVQTREDRANSDDLTDPVLRAANPDGRAANPDGRAADSAGRAANPYGRAASSAGEGADGRAVWRAWVIGVSLAILAGWALRLFLLNAWPLREDESIYAYWARVAWTDPRFLHTWPDKPPVFLWLQALALAAFGYSGAAARMVSLFASAATIALTADVARRVGGRYAGIMAAWLLALSPFAISFGATGYTDSLLVFWGMFSLALALRCRPLWAGAALGAAIMTKQQGALYIPLVVGALYLVARDADVSLGAASGASPGASWGSGRGLRMWLRLLGGVLLVVLPIVAWDASRWAVAPSPWDLGVRNYGALGIVPVGEWAARVQAWIGLIWYLAGSGLAWTLLALALCAGLVARRGHPADRGRRWLWWLLVVWSAGFLVVHIVTTVPAWDRYLLPLAPVLAIVVSAPAAVLWSRQGALWSRQGVRWAAAAGAAVMAIALLAGPGWTAARGGYPIGADHGAFTGFDEAMAWLESQADDGTIVYHQLLGWQTRYALFDAVERGDMDLRWFPNAVYLADNAAKAPGSRRFLIEPAWAATPDLYPALASRSLEITPVLRSEQIVVSEITDKARGVCDWCRCVAPLWPTIRPIGLQSDDQPIMCTP